MPDGGEGTFLRFSALGAGSFALAAGAGARGFIGTAAGGEATWSLARATKRADSSWLSPSSVRSAPSSSARLCAWHTRVPGSRGFQDFARSRRCSLAVVASVAEGVDGGVEEYDGEEAGESARARGCGVV